MANATDPAVAAMATALAASGIAPPSGRRRGLTIAARLAALRPVAHERLLEGWSWEDLVAWIRKPVDAHGKPLRSADGHEIAGIQASSSTVRRVIGTPPARMRTVPEQGSQKRGSRMKRRSGQGQQQLRDTNGQSELSETLKQADRSVSDESDGTLTDYDQMDGRGGK